MEDSQEKAVYAIVDIYAKKTSSSAATGTPPPDPSKVVYDIVDMYPARRSSSASAAGKPLHPPSRAPPPPPAPFKKLGPPVPQKSVQLMADIEKKRKKRRVPPPKPVPYHIYILTRKSSGTALTKITESTGNKGKKKAFKDSDSDSDSSSDSD